MFEFRVTKYDPTHRDREGRYLLDEWTAFSDVGSKVDLAEYERVERSYIDVALAFMAEASVASLSVANLENPQQVALPFARDAHLHETELRTAFQLGRTTIALRRITLRWSVTQRYVMRTD